MKSKQISGFIAALFLPLVLSGQTDTYSVDIASFSSKKYDEFSPVYFNNGIVFCSNRNHRVVSNYLTPENEGLFKINYVETSTGKDSRKVRLLSQDLISRFNDGPSSFTKGGDTIYFSRNLKVDGKVSELSNPRNKLGIFTAILENDKWVKITDLRFNNEYYNITMPFIAPDGKRLFFASDNPQGYGGSDLYYCQWKTDFWDEPVNLGPEVNTSGNESYPFVNREGAVYFSSDGQTGLGGKDIFYTRQSNDSTWLPPVRLDAPINSEFDDFALLADSVMNEGYFSSNRNGSIDIFRFKTNIHQVFYCENEKVNQYCFRFTDEGKIPIDDRFVHLVWDFGDGSKANGQNVEHCFTGPGRYAIRLDVLDKKTGEVFFSKLSYVIELTDFEQPVISSSPTGIIGTPVAFNGSSSHYPGYDILNYTWYFGDGTRTTGNEVTHTFVERRDYEVKLGLIIRNRITGIIHNACISKPVKIVSDKLEKAALDKKTVAPPPVVNILEYRNARIENMYSSEKEYNPDMIFQVEAVASKMKLKTDDKIFARIPVKYKLKETYLPGENIYCYTICEENSLMATYPALLEIRNLGYKSARVKAFTLEDLEAKELNNLEKVFGVSADVFFRKNDPNISIAGTQLLDLILGFLVKYPSVILEIANHTDSIGTEAANLTLTQKRSESMVNYLVDNGISRKRLVAKGYGESRPVASNVLETDRKLNRRVDFVIIE